MNHTQRRNFIAALVLLGTTALCTMIAIPMPESAFDRLTPTALLLNGLPVAYFFLAFLLVTRRPLSAASLTVVVCVAITLGSNFKFSIVSQPVVASDFIVFGQVLENPVLFEKYLREQWFFVPLLLAVLALPVWAMRFEQPLVNGRRVGAICVVAGIFLLWQIQALLLMPGAPLQRGYITLMPVFDRQDPMASVKEHGLFATLIISAGQSYFVPPRTDAADEALIRQLAVVTGEQKSVTGNTPNVVVIQSEAFYDFRAIDAEFAPTAYALWDQVRRTGQYGMAAVDTYGGATLRTEFSLLTGVPTALFGAEMDYPYLTVVKSPMAAIPHHLKELGYETIAIHPFHETFWRRNQAYPRLGIDTFLSLEDFQDAERDGPYVSDKALCEKIKGQLESGDKPRFIFSVTMENHGPWSFDRGQLGPLKPTDTEGRDLPEEIDLQLQRYLYHFRNAAAMASCIIDALESSQRPGVLLFLGDHAPAMPAVFAEFSVGNPWQNPALRKVPYLLWRSESTDTGPVDIPVSALASQLLESAGLPLDEFLRVSDYLRQQCSQSAATGNCPGSTEAAMLALARQRLRPLEND